MTKKRDPIKAHLSDSAKTLCTEVEHQHGAKLQHAQALELIASYYGYKSKAAMDDDQIYLDPNEPDTLLRDCYRAQSRIARRMCELNNQYLRYIAFREMTHLIHDSVTPACSFCGVRNRETLPVITGKDYNPNTQWICEDCIPKNPEEVGHCRYCDDEVYDVSVLNQAGECPEHAGESSYTEEEEEDMDSYVEYWQNH